jgi:hypothetical protein
VELRKDFIPVPALAKSSSYTERESCPWLYSKQVTSAMNGIACCRNVYGSNFLCHGQIVCRYFRFVVIIRPCLMVTKVIALQSEEVMVLLTCLRIKISQDFSQVLDSASCERRYEAIYNWVTLKVNWIYDTRIDHSISLQCIYFRLFTVCCNKNSWYLIIPPFPLHFHTALPASETFIISWHEIFCSQLSARVLLYQPTLHNYSSSRCFSNLSPVRFRLCAGIR